MPRRSNGSSRCFPLKPTGRGHSAWVLNKQPCYLAVLAHPIRFEGSECVLSWNKYCCYSIIFPWPAPPGPHKLSGCLKSWGPSLIKGRCLYRMSLLFFWQEWDIVTIFCLLSMWSAVAVRLSNSVQGEQQWALLSGLPYVWGTWESHCGINKSCCRKKKKKNCIKTFFFFFFKWP